VVSAGNKPSLYKGEQPGQMPTKGKKGKNSAGKKESTKKPSLSATAELVLKTTAGGRNGPTRGTGKRGGKKKEVRRPGRRGEQIKF